MATEAAANLEDLTTCTICLETFTRPKRLPCEHSYCYSCLLLLGKDRSTITCPYCQEEHVIPDSGVTGFKDNLLLNNLVGMSLPKVEVCVDCKERPSVDECEHCNLLLCHKCLLDHSKLSMELSYSITHLKHYLTASITPARQLQLETSRTTLEDDRARMNKMLRSEALNKLIEVKILLERVNSLDNMMSSVSELYEMLSSEEKDMKSEEYVSLTLRQTGECATVDSLKNFKNKVADLETFVRLLQTKDEEFKFRYSSSPQDGSGQVEFGQAVVNVRGKYQTENIVNLITQFVQDSTETLTNHVTPTCTPRADHVVSLPHPLSAADAQTETEERFLETNGEKKASVGQVEESEYSPAEDAAHSVGYSARSSRNDFPTSSNVAAVEKYCQNEPPRNVDYAGKGKTGSVMVIGKKKVERGHKLFSPWGCAYHVERDEILVADLGNSRIMAYSADGRSARVFYTGVRYPRDVAVSSDGQHVYIATSESIRKLNMNGELVKSIDEFSLGTFKNCISVKCYQESVIVVDQDHRCVVVFNDVDEEVMCFGTEHVPFSVAVSEDRMFYVTLVDSSCVSVFDWAGHYMQTFAGMDRDDDIWGIAVDGDGNVCVSRHASHRIDVYNPQRELLTSISGPGRRPGQLSDTRGICLTPGGRLLVADRNNDRVQIF